MTNSRLALALAACLLGGLLQPCLGRTPAARKKVAAICTVYRQNSHADVIVGRLLQGYTLDGKGDFPTVELASLYVDQTPADDLSRKLQERYHFPIFDKVADALTLGTDRLAVDGVLLVAEHGDYSLSDTGQTLYPKRRLFSQIVEVFERSQRVVPVFSDKHLADNWQDADWIYQTAQRLKIPLMAGSSLPTAWREPPIDIAAGTPLKEVVAVGFGGLEAYGFHTLEMAQCLAERRAGGETGVSRVRYVQGSQVWAPSDKPLFDRELLQKALAQFKRRPIPVGKSIDELVPQPHLFQFEYRDGLRLSAFVLTESVEEFTVAWRTADDNVAATNFVLQEGRPFMHFSYLLKGFERMIETGKPAWPAERTLLTSGMLNAVLISKRDAGRTVETPYLDVKYEPSFTWVQPPPPPPTRPADGY